MLVLSAHLGEVVVDVFEDVPQADALRMADDAYPVHGRDLVFEAPFHIGEQVLHRGEFGKGIVQGAFGHAGLKAVQPFAQEVRVVRVLAREDVLHVGEPVAQALDAFCDIVVHWRRPLLAALRNAGCARYWP